MRNRPLPPPLPGSFDLLLNRINRQEEDIDKLLMKYQNDTTQQLNPALQRINVDEKRSHPRRVSQHLILPQLVKHSIKKLRSSQSRKSAILQRKKSPSPHRKKYTTINTMASRQYVMSAQPNAYKSAKGNQLMEMEKEPQMNIKREDAKLVPQPLAYLSPPSQGSSSEGEEAPVAYYAKEFRALIKTQCFQEQNFLYFAKSEKLSDWTERLLLLFEKHDKQLLALRTKCRFLSSFDKEYFAVEVFNND